NFAAKHNLPIIATNNVHYLVKDDYRTYRYLFKIKSMGIDGAASGKPVCNDEHYFKSQAEMITMFGDIPQAISAANLIENKCELKLPLISINASLYKKKKLLPDEIKENKTGLNKAEVNKAEAKQLKNLCFKNGLKRRYGDNPPPQIYDRLKKELDIIIEMGLCKYFLVAADIAEFARENNIPICGKGSSAGSLVSYLLGISDIDPIENNLYFERFLNRERREPPDIDIDISSKRRTEIIKYLTCKYGTDSIARVCTFSTLKQDAAVREAGRILGLGKEEIADENITGEETVNEGTVNEGTVNPKKISCKEISYISRKIKDYPRHVSMHPSAFIISGPEFDEKIPLTLSGTGEIMSQYDIDSVKEMGLFKIDLISSLTLSLVDDVATMLKKTRNIDFNPLEIKYDDATTFNLIKNGDTLGVFQLESSGIRQLAKRIKPSTLNDITHLISLYRPAPSATGMTGIFIERKMGREKITYIHRDLEPILNETYGIILYQEQVMRIAVCIAGYSLSEADNLRKAVKASSEEEIKSQAGRFVEGAISRGYSKEQAEKIFKLISLFTNYSFVKAHAAAYAGLSYKVCYIKAHYPAELISVILTNNSGYYAAARYIEEARRCGIKIKLPDINKSGFEFSVEDEGKSIRIPLLAINGLGRAGVESILHERAKEKNFENFTDFYYRISGRYRITDKAIENLIKAGAFDFEGQKRKQLLLYYHYLKSLKTSRNTFRPGSASSGTGSGSGTISTGFLPFIGSNSRDFSFDEKLVMEEKILGFCASYSPLEYYRNELVKYPIIESSSFSVAVNKKIVFTAGIVISRKTIKTKSGRDMLLCIMEDRGGMYEAVFFPNGCRKNYKIITRN
ncbi:MAG: DNA polymerase III subunit alpha, partial [Actinomycetota bacterium]|nr:DNA polymerase III subunit alpha [Actinomycetota bacterium]